MLGQMSFYVGVNCGSAQREEGHLRCFEVFLLSVELVGDEEGEGGRGDCEDVLVWCFNGFAI